MKGFKDKKFDFRINMAAEAKRAQLEKVQAKALESKAGAAERKKALQIRSAEQSRKSAEINDAKRAVEAERVALQDAAKAAQVEALRLAKAESDAREAARLEALALEKETRKAELAAKAAKDLTLEADRKIARDARYQARKARQK